MRARSRQQRELCRALDWNSEISNPTLRRLKPARSLNLQLSLQTLFIGVTALAVWMAVWRTITDHIIANAMLESLICAVATLAGIRSASGWQRVRLAIKLSVGLGIYVAYFVGLIYWRDISRFVGWSAMQSTF